MRSKSTRRSETGRGRWARVRRVVSWTVLAGLMGIAGCNLWIVLSTRDRVYDLPAQLPDNEVGLVLGTSNRTVDGGANAFFRHRMAAAAELYHAGKVRRLLVSGHRDDAYYDEPRFMRTALIELGVPSEAIMEDGAGHRTLDSIVRAGEVHGLTRFTVITQRDHCYRALFLARAYGLDADGYAARPAPPLHALRVGVREATARVKAVLDLYVLGTRPRAAD